MPSIMTMTVMIKREMIGEERLQLTHHVQVGDQGEDDQQGHDHGDYIYHVAQDEAGGVH